MLILMGISKIESWIRDMLMIDDNRRGVKTTEKWVGMGIVVVEQEPNKHVDMMLWKGFVLLKGILIKKSLGGRDLSLKFYVKFLSVLPCLVYLGPKPAPKATGWAGTLNCPYCHPSCTSYYLPLIVPMLDCLHTTQTC